MADQDIAAIIAYLRSDSPITQPVEVSRPLPTYSFLAKALLKLGAMKPLPIPESPINFPSPNNLPEYGQYLATLSPIDTCASATDLKLSIPCSERIHQQVMETVWHHYCF